MQVSFFDAKLFVDDPKQGTGFACGETGRGGLGQLLSIGCLQQWNPGQLCIFIGRSPLVIRGSHPKVSEAEQVIPWSGNTADDVHHVLLAGAIGEAELSHPTLGMVIHPGQVPNPSVLFNSSDHKDAPHLTNKWGVAIEKEWNS